VDQDHYPVRHGLSCGQLHFPVQAAPVMDQPHRLGLSLMKRYQDKKADCGNERDNAASHASFPSQTQPFTGARLLIGLNKKNNMQK